VTLSLVLGPANSAKAGEVLGAYAAAAPRGALLVVPTAGDARHYAHELAADGVVLGTITTFAGLVAEIARRAGYGARWLTALQRERVLERVVAGLRLDVLAASAQGAGFPAAAGRLIAELQRALITPAQFTSALRRWAARDVRRAPYAGELGRLYSAYRSELDRIGRVDADLYAWRAVDALRAAPDRWSHPTRDAVFVYGFDDLTGLERDAVQTLVRIPGVDVTVSLSYEPGHPGLEARAETVEDLRPLAERVIELPAQDTYYASESRRALHHLERRLFTADPPRLDPGDAVVLLEAGGERAEAEQIAQFVARLLDDGMEPEQIVVIARRRDGVAPVLGRVFDQYGIVLHDVRARRFAHTALGRGLIAAARCALLADEARAADLLTYLRTPGRLERVEIADGLEARVLREGMRSAVEARAALDWVLPELDDLARARDPLAQLCSLARELLAAPRRGRAAPLDGAAALDAAAVRALTDAAVQLAELGWRAGGATGSSASSPERLIGLLEELEVEAPADAGPAEGVLLAEPLQVRARRFRVVVVCGLQEGEFPAPGTPEPFLSDDRRFSLALDGGLRLRPREEALAAERYLLYAAVSRATDRVVLSYRSSDEEGNLATPSPFIDDVAILWSADWWGRRRRRLLADVVWDPAQAPTERERQRAFAAAVGASAGEPPPPKRALGADALARIRHSRILSPGALESYGACAVRWLIERELAPEALEPEPDAITRGTVIHSVLERLFEELGGPLGPGTVPQAREILDRLLAAVQHGSGPHLVPGASEVVRAAALRAIEADLRRYVEHEARTSSGWSPLGVEMRFGFEENSLPPLELGEQDERVAVRGVIDRVDVDGRGHAIVRDYKSGAQNSGWPAARWDADRTLQVALYMLVVRELTPLEPVGGFYQPLRGRDLRARGLFLAGADVGTGVVENDARQPAEVDELLADAAARAIELAGALRRGELTACPQTCSRGGCAYPAICRSQ
jgi:ATP-dependent helicase/DNAse subunit B